MYCKYPNFVHSLWCLIEIDGTLAYQRQKMGADASLSESYWEILGINSWENVFQACTDLQFACQGFMCPLPMTTGVWVYIITYWNMRGTFYENIFHIIAKLLGKHLFLHR